MSGEAVGSLVMYFSLGYYFSCKYVPSERAREGALSGAIVTYFRFRDVYNTFVRFVTCYTLRAGSAGLYLVQVGAPNAADFSIVR